MDDPRPDAEVIVREFIETWNARDFDHLSDLVADDYVLRDPAAPGGEVRGAGGASRWLRQIVEGFPDFEIEVMDCLADETTAMVELEYRGTHRGSFQGVSPTGESVRLRGMEKHEIENGQLVETRVHLDNQEFRSQLGLAFPEVLMRLPELLWSKWTSET